MTIIVELSTGAVERLRDAAAALLGAPERDPLSMTHQSAANAVLGLDHK